MTIKSSFNTFLLILCWSILTPFGAKSQRLTSKKIDRLIVKSELLKNHFVGISIYDEDKDKVIYQNNADKKFIPASNTKILTLFTCLEMLGDSIPALKYTIRNDSLFFWGTGDPTLGYSKFKSQNVIQFLKKAKQKLFFIPSNYNEPFYGYGWNYDDYQYYYQVEKSAFPIDGNTVVITGNEKKEINISPKRIIPFFASKKTLDSKEFKVNRDLYTNSFSYPENTKPEPNYYQEIPLKTNHDLSCLLLQDKIEKPITILNIPIPTENKIIYSEKTDDVLKQMMLTSDNFLAEQLLLLCASTLNNELSTNAIITYSKNQWFPEIASTIEWADGSGLSRFNLISPNSFVSLLKKIKRKINNIDRLQSLFPAGGQTGTLKKAYTLDNGKAFVWAKTGTLTNNYNQSGYLITKKGKKLIFSFMNNNFLEDASIIRKEMSQILTEIHNNF